MKSRLHFYILIYFLHAASAFDAAYNLTKIKKLIIVNQSTQMAIFYGYVSHCLLKVYCLKYQFK